MKRASDFKVGDLVFKPPYMISGEVEKVAADCVAVRWEDGTVGILDENPHVLYSLQTLQIGKRVNFMKVRP